MYNFDDPYCWEEEHWNMNAVAKLFDFVFVTSKKRLLDYQKNGPKAYYVPPASHEERHFYDPDPEFKSDVSMAITNFYDPDKFPALVSRLKIAQELCADKDINFALYGPENLREQVPACYKGLLDQNISRKLFSSSKINMSTSVIDAEGYMSDRVPFVTMSKGLLLMDPIEVSRSVFKHGESCFVIDRDKKITEQVKEILALPVLERDRIRANGQKIAIEKMTYSSWAKTIVNAIGAE
jgi:spore maturation protein CgeB